MVPVGDIRLFDASGKGGREWLIGEFRNGDRIEGAVFNTNSGGLLGRFPIEP